MIKTLTAPIRSIIRFPLFQLAIVVALIVWMQAADDSSVLGQGFNVLDKLVEATVNLFAVVFTVKSFTKSWLTSGFMIAYIYLACLIILSIARIAIMRFVDLIGWTNAFWLRNTIARERGIAAYRAWVPLERIRPNNISQDEWETAFAWPPNDKPPYRPLPYRIGRTIIGYVGVFLLATVLLQALTPLPALRWLGEILKRMSG